MLFRADSLVYRELPAIRRALVRLIDEVPALERGLKQQARLGLLDRYRQTVGELAEADEQAVSSQALQDYWRETAKEFFGALGQPVDPLRRQVEPGLYRSAFLDTLYNAAQARLSLRNLVELIFRLEPATGLDPALAYGVLERMNTSRRAECKTLAEELRATFGTRPMDVERHLCAAAERFGMRVVDGGARGRKAFVLPDEGQPWRHGLRLRDMHRHAYSMLYFDFLLLDRSGRVHLQDFGPRDHVAVALECIFPGHGTTYGVFRSELEMQLCIYAAFAQAQALSRCLAATAGPRGATAVAR